MTLTRTGPGEPMGDLLRRYWTPILLASELPEKDGPPVRVKVMSERLLAFQAMFTSVLDSIRAGERAGPRASILKILNAEVSQALGDLMLEASGSLGMALEPMMAGGRRVSVGLSFLQVRRQTIYGGTSEIQRNILAKRVLDLGNEPKRGA